MSTSAHNVINFCQYKINLLLALEYATNLLIFIDLLKIVLLSISRAFMQVRP